MLSRIIPPVSVQGVEGVRIVGSDSNENTAIYIDKNDGTTMRLLFTTLGIVYSKIDGATQTDYWNKSMR